MPYSSQRARLRKRGETLHLRLNFQQTPKKRPQAKPKTPVIREIPSGTRRAPLGSKTNVTLRIEKDSDGRTTTLRLIGRMRREHIEELKAQIKAGGPNVTLDLNEVSLVDLDVIRFLATCQTEGISIVHCSRYINNWIAKERFRGQ
jgi:hypothetical protein